MKLLNPVNTPPLTPSPIFGTPHRRPVWKRLPRRTRTPTPALSNRHSRQPHLPKKHTEQPSGYATQPPIITGKDNGASSNYSGSRVYSEPPESSGALDTVPDSDFEKKSEVEQKSENEKKSEVSRSVTGLDGNVGVSGQGPDTNGSVVGLASKAVGGGAEVGSFSKQLVIKGDIEDDEECVGIGNWREAAPDERKAIFQCAMERILNRAVLFGLLGTWYYANIMFNIYNKQVLQVFPYPATCTTVHLLVGSFIMGALWLLRIKKPPRLSRRMVSAVLPLSGMHMFGFLLTNMSLGAVAVSLTHTIKAMEPFFTVILSYLFLSTIPTIPVLSTLVPIVLGVVVATATDVSFNWWGFAAAMGSNLGFQSRNVLSKRIMVQSSLDSLEGGMPDAVVNLDEVNLFGVITIGATALILPYVLFSDAGVLMKKFAAASSPSEVVTWEMARRCLLAGIFRFGDVLASYAILQRLTPVSHSVGNCVKRVVVIAASIVFFKTPASLVNIIGTGVALTGVLAYSLAKKLDKGRVDLRDAVERVSPVEVFTRRVMNVLGLEEKFFKEEEKEIPEEETGIEYYI